jgi:hypothetical protein
MSFGNKNFDFSTGNPEVVECKTQYRRVLPSCQGFFIACRFMAIDRSQRYVPAPDNAPIPREIQSPTAAMGPRSIPSLGWINGDATIRRTKPIK